MIDIAVILRHRHDARTLVFAQPLAQSLGDQPQYIGVGQAQLAVEIGTVALAVNHGEVFGMVF